jgi:hypothetical protein
MYEQMYPCVKLRFDCKRVYVNKGKNSICKFQFFFLFFKFTLVLGKECYPVPITYIGNGHKRQPVTIVLLLVTGMLHVTVDGLFVTLYR